MNGLHDLGGMHGFGPVIPEREGLLFKEDWHRRALALVIAMGASGKWSLDESRFARESLPPADMVTLSYYERWIAALTALLYQYGLVSEEELRNGKPDATVPKSSPALTADKVSGVLARGAPVDRPLDREPRFRIGDMVRARNINAPTHIRLPRYTRGKVGEIILYHGGHIFADANAHEKSGRAEPLYTIRFTAQELWGVNADPHHSVTVDLWEPHLEPA